MTLQFLFFDCCEITLVTFIRSIPVNSLHMSLQYLLLYCCEITHVTLISYNPVNSPPYDSSVHPSLLLQNHTQHIDKFHSCEQRPHDSSVPPSLLLRNYTPHIENSFSCNCTYKSSVSLILSPRKPAIPAIVQNPCDLLLGHGHIYLSTNFLRD